MGQAHYYSGTDRSIGGGSYNLFFDPTGDSAHATVTNVAYRFLLSYRGGQKVDLGDIDIYLYSPDGERHTIYYNFDGFGDDNDDNNDSDSANDYDIYFDGSGGESTFSAAFDGDPVNGNWRLRIDNDTGKTLTLYYFESWVDFHSAPDMIVDDIAISGTRALGERVTITATLKNIGETDYLGVGKNFDVSYYVNGKLVGTDSVSFGLDAGQSNKESFTYTVTEAGQQNIEVRVSGISGEARTDNNSKSTGFTAEAPDLVVQDIKIFGDVKPGQEVRIEAILANIGGADYGGMTKGGFDLEYFVEKADGTQRKIGTDAVSFGLTAGQTNSESIRYTLKSGDTGKFTVKIVGTRNEDTFNNTRTEYAGENNEAAHSLQDSMEHVKIGTLFARAVYGQEDISDHTGSQKAGLDDDYAEYFKDLDWTVLDQAGLGKHYVEDENGRFTDGGLFEGKTDALIHSWDAQSLVATGETRDGSKTLVLSFRGTDEDDSGGPAVVNGQAFTGDGLFHHYNAHKPLVEAALSYANDASNGIDKVIVSGHSLGGSMADIFTAVDAQRLRADIDLTVVSLASAGIDKTLYTQTELFDGFETQHDYGVVDVDGGRISLTAPEFYIGISHDKDAVTFAERVDLDTIDGYVGNNILRNNVNFDDAISQFHLPNLDNAESSTGKFLFPKGFGAHHVAGLYWVHVQALVEDRLAKFYSGTEKLTFGLTDYDAVKDIDGADLPTFPTYTRADETGYDNDTGSAALIGSTADDFILGLSGDDRIDGRGGEDLLSGGAGHDDINAGAGNDRVAGGSGNDTVNGGAGNDIAWLGGGADTYTEDTRDKGRDKVLGQAGADTISTGAGNDRIKGGKGADEISGGGGRDRINGGGGADDISGGGGNDRINGGSGRDQIAGNAGKDRIKGGTGRDSIDAGAGHDRVDAGKGRDRVDLGRGNDTFTDTAQGGKAGRDVITGGKGADTFHFAKNMSKDRITDYRTGTDALSFDSTLWDPDLSADDLILDVAHVRKHSVLLDFGGGDKLILSDLTTTDGLADDLMLVVV